MPDWGQEIRTFLTGLELEPTHEAEIVEELGQHLNDRYEELLAEGANKQQARQAVLVELSGGKLGEELRRIVGPAAPPVALGRDEPGSPVAGLWRDLRFGARLLRLNPGFAAVALLSLALGIGANTAIFQLLDAVRMRTLPVHDPQQLVSVKVVKTSNGRTGSFTGQWPQLTNAIWAQVRDRQEAFSNIAAWSAERLNLSPGGEARYAQALWVSGSFFDTLGVRPALGRLIAPSHDQPGCTSTGVVISHSFWQREYGGRASVLGHKLTVQGHPFEVIGVTPPSFYGVEVGRNYDFAIPLCAEGVITPEKPRLTDAQAWWLAAIGRLKPGWTVERASAHLAAISRGIFEATLPAAYDEGDRKNYVQFVLGALPAANGFSSLRREYETPLWLLMGISGLVLLIACANLANLLLARASVRQREMAVRIALGASRSRLIRQVLAESLLLALLGALGGVALAQMLSRALVSFLSTEHSPLFVNLAPDWRVLGFTAGLAVLTCLLFGLTPAVQAARTAPNEAMKAGGRGITPGRQRFGLRRALVVSQVALSLVLLVGALLFVRTFRNLMNLDAGFQREQILFTDVDFSVRKLSAEGRRQHKQQLLERVRAIPGVSSAASVFIVPVSGDGWNNSIKIQGAEDKRRLANFNRVTPGYFRTVGTPLLAGRDFSERDNASAPPVALVTETFARKFLNGANPVGKAFSVVQQAGQPDLPFQIVGMVKDTKYTDLREDFTPIVYLAEAQDKAPGLHSVIVTRSALPLSDLTSAVKRAMAEVDPAMVLTFRVFETAIRNGLLRERLMATLSGFFGFLAAVLAMVGLYGVISYMVVRRRNEIGLRMALGADRGSILTMVMREAFTLLLTGLVLGAGLALAAGGAARALLFGLRPSDPVTMVIAALGLAVVALAASFFPAQKAARLDPMQALRDE